MKLFEWGVRTVYAYALGYYEGRVNGVDENNPFDDSNERWAFKLGYNRGVTDYCDEQETAAEA